MNRMLCVATLFLNSGVAFGMEESAMVVDFFQNHYQPYNQYTRCMYNQYEQEQAYKTAKCKRFHKTGYMLQEVAKNSIEGVQSYLDKGFHIDSIGMYRPQGSPDNRYLRKSTATSIAALYGYEIMLDFLLKEGANPDIPNQNGDTPLMLAASRGHVGVVKQLCNAGADIYATNNNGETALQQVYNSDLIFLLQDEFSEIIEILQSVETEEYFCEQ